MQLGVGIDTEDELRLFGDHVASMVERDALVNDDAGAWVRRPFRGLRQV
jgi:hypothetical protein